MNEKSKKDSDMAMRVFLGFMGELNKHLVYAGRANEPLKGYTEYVNIEKAWHSNEETPTMDDACLINTSGENFEIGHFAYNTWETDFTFYTQEEIARWAYIEDLLPSR